MRLQSPSRRASVHGLALVLTLGIASLAHAEPALRLARTGLAGTDLDDAGAAVARALPRDQDTATVGAIHARRLAPGTIELEDRSRGLRTTVLRTLGSRLVILDQRKVDARPLSRAALARRQGTAEAEVLHAGNHYRTDRFLDEYAGSFGDAFAHDVAQLGAGQHWIDLGAGHAVAQRGYRADALKKGLTPAALTAVAISRPPAHLDEDGFASVEPVGDWLTRERPTGFRFLEGRVERMATKTLRPAQLVTDHHGAFYYAKRPDRVLERALSSLVVGGRFYALAPASDTHLQRWLGGVKGARLVELAPVPGQKLQRIVLEKTAATARVPLLRTTGYQIKPFSSNDPVDRTLEVVAGKTVRPLAQPARTARAR